MTEAELYEFDLNGYIVFRNALDADEIGTIEQALREVRPSEKWGKFSFFDLHPLFMDIMSRPSTLEVMRVMLGRWLRFDHALGIRMTRDMQVKENLHAGPLEAQRSFFYQWVQGRMHNGLVKVLYALNDVNSGDGGFICIPGSHKANVPHQVKPDSHLVVNPSLRTGDMLVFTEALVHGSAQWSADRVRTALIYSYAPGYMAWRNPETIRDYARFARTDAQRDLLRHPFVGDYDEKAAAATGQWPTDRRLDVRFNS